MYIQDNKLFIGSGVIDDDFFYKMTGNVREFVNYDLRQILYSELNSDWLIYGRGEIWKKSLLCSRLSPENDLELRSIASRINKIILILNISISHFANIIGSNKVAIHNLTTGATHNLSVDLLTKITNAYPEINQDWLLTGNGNPTHSFND